MALNNVHAQAMSSRELQILDSSVFG